MHSATGAPALVVTAGRLMREGSAGTDTRMPVDPVSTSMWVTLTHWVVSPGLQSRTVTNGRLTDCTLRAVDGSMGPSSTHTGTSLACAGLANWQSLRSGTWMPLSSLALLEPTALTWTFDNQGLLIAVLLLPPSPPPPPQDVASMPRQMMSSLRRDFEWLTNAGGVNGLLCDNIGAGPIPGQMFVDIW